jgi:hypothetical protein
MIATGAAMATATATAVAVEGAAVTSAAVASAAAIGTVIWPIGIAVVAVGIVAGVGAYVVWRRRHETIDATWKRNHMERMLSELDNDQTAHAYYQAIKEQLLKTFTSLLNHELEQTSKQVSVLLHFGSQIRLGVRFLKPVLAYLWVTLHLIVTWEQTRKGRPASKLVRTSDAERSDQPDLTHDTGLRSCCCTCLQGQASDFTLQLVDGENVVDIDVNVEVRSFQGLSLNQAASTYLRGTCLKSSRI